MKKTVSESDFFAAFRAYGREDQFSNQALDLLFEYFQSLEEDTGEEIELDPIAICCEYNELTFAEIAAEYDISTKDEDGEDIDEDDLKDAVRDYLEYNTCVIGETREGTIVYASF